MSVGERIKEKRVAAGMTQQQLADQVLTSRVYIAKIEIGNKNASVQMLKGIAHALGCTMDELAG